jgi:hypothetical protein
VFIREDPASADEPDVSRRPTKRERGTVPRRQWIHEQVLLPTDAGVTARRRVGGAEEGEVGDLRLDGSGVVDEVEAVPAGSFDDDLAPFPAF